MSKHSLIAFLINLYRNIVKVKQMELFQTGNKSGSRQHRMNKGNKIAQNIAMKNSAFGFKNSHQTEVEVSMTKLG